MADPSGFELRAVVIENLRGFTATTLPLNRSRTVVVGRNNSGKTSVLKLLQWLMNDVEPKLLKPQWQLPDDTATLLLPARDTPHKARRLTLQIKVPDGRSYRRFLCDDAGIATLRLNVRLSHDPTVYLSVGPPTRSESSETTDVALELLDKVREAVTVVYVPSFRDAGSGRFKDTLLKSLTQRVEARAVHRSQGGAFKEYRAVNKAYKDIKNVVEGLTKPLWPAMQLNLPPGLVSGGRVTMTSSIEDLVSWATQSVAVTVSTGTHDSATVPMTELGSGLQSLLDLAVQRSDAAGKNLLLVVEEPESFLHPSAQRVITRSLLRDISVGALVVTTHSSVVVDEAKYGEVVVCRDQKFYYPRELDDDTRNEINSALMTGQGAEMMFARSVLFVEGESDRLYFEKLRRRIAAVDASGKADELYVVAVGGKRSFGPWVRLLESYGTPRDRPIQWLIAADADAAPDVRRGLTEAGVTVPREVSDHIGVVGQKSQESKDEWTTAARALNSLARQHQLPFMLLPLDLEAAALSGCSADTLALVSKTVECSASTLTDLLTYLGSKAGERSNSPEKAPWIRGFLGARTPWNDLSADIRDVLRRWLAPVMGETAISRLLNDPRLHTTFE